jgi:hypothetical protein
MHLSRELPSVLFPESNLWRHSCTNTEILFNGRPALDCADAASINADGAARVGILLDLGNCWEYRI